MKKKFDKYIGAFKGLTLVEVAVSSGILAMAMVASVQLRQLSNNQAKTATVNSQITEEHRVIANLVASIPKIQANSIPNSLFKNLSAPGDCPAHPAATLKVDTTSGKPVCCRYPASCPLTLGPAVANTVWEDLTNAFWEYVSSFDTENPSEAMSVDKFNDTVLPQLTTAGCVNCHSGTNYFYDRAGKWGLGSPLGRVLLNSSITLAGTLKDQNLSHEINFEARSFDLLTGEPNPQPNEQCRDLVDTNTWRQLNGCQSNCTLNQIVAGTFSCTCVKTCCNSSGKNCSCCAKTSRFRCFEPQVSQTAATCTSPLIMSGYDPYKSGACGRSGVRTYWQCLSPSTTSVTTQITKYAVSYTVTTSWVNQIDRLPRSMVTRGELK